MTIIAKYFVILFFTNQIPPSLTDPIVAANCTRTLNRIFDYWQPYDIYVILNLTSFSLNSTDGGVGIDDDKTNEANVIIGAMVYPRYVMSATTPKGNDDDFSNFIHNHRRHSICSVFPDNFVLVIFTDDSCHQNVIPILRHQLSQKIIFKRTKILIVVVAFGKSRVSVQFSPIERLFRQVWNMMGLLNVFVLDGTFIYGFNPFTRKFLIRHPAEDYKRLIGIDRAANFHGAVLRVPQMEVYPGYQSIVWARVPKKIGTFYFMQQPFEEFFNATVVAYTQKDHDFGFEFVVNSSLSIVHPGMGKDLVLGLGDLTLISRSYDSSKFFDFLSPLTFKECNLIIPKAGQLPQHEILAMVATSWTRLFSLVVIVLIIAFTGLMKRVLRLEFKMSRFVFELGSSYIGQPLTIPIDRLTLRLIVAAWLLTCILLGTLFNAEIVMGFTRPMFVRDYDNPFDVIAKSHFNNVYAFDDFVYFLKGNSKKLFPSEQMFQLLLKKLKGVPRDEFFRRVLHPNKKDMFMVISMADNLLEKTKYLTEQTYSYHKTKPFFISLTANIVPRGSIIYNHYNDFNYRIFEAGLLQHWKNLEFVYERKFGKMTGDNFDESDDGDGMEPMRREHSLTIEDLYSAFLVLGFGYALALSGFVIENCLRKV